VTLKGATAVVPSATSADEAFARVLAARAMRPFAAEIQSFVKGLSDAILRSPGLRAFPETIAFGYWIRGARLQQMEAAFGDMKTTGMMTPRGVAFHIAPANVDTIFLYSLVISLLVGNRNVVRISSRESAQVGELVKLLQTLIARPEHAAMADRLLIVRYDHSDAVTRQFTQGSDIRVVWGGDQTVNAIRSIPMPPHGVELTFADKVSLAVLDARAYLDGPEPAQLARMFFNDAYWFGQMACSSPRLVAWRGGKEEVDLASERFWSALETHLDAEETDLSTMDFMNKLVAEQTYAALAKGSIRRGAGNLANVVRVDAIGDLSMEDHCGGGLFLECRIANLAELAPMITPRHQTVTSFGVSRAEWEEFLDKERPHGIDRIVPLGEALNFASVWDGQDLFRAFCREITIGS
jgi:hypothetical protein